MTSPPADPIAALGAYLTEREATGLAARIDAGVYTEKALGWVSDARRVTVTRLFTEAGLGSADPIRTVAVLRAIAGAKHERREILPVWTMPRASSAVGHLTGEFSQYLASAQRSVVCATYNFTSNSRMWNLLRDIGERPGVAVTVYVDGETTDADLVAQQMPRCAVYASTAYRGKHVVSHAKFIVIDRRQTLLTSANFSYNAENNNVEFGVLIDSPAFAASVEATMAEKHGVFYRRVVPSDVAA